MRKAKIMPPEGRTAGLWEQPQPFVLPHSVEMAFVHSMECPFCHSHLLMNQAPPKSPEKVYCPVCGWKPRVPKEAAGYSDDFRTLLGMMKNALNNEDYSEIYQLCARMSILADELDAQAKVDHSFMNDSIPGHRDLANWIYPQDDAAHRDLIDKHVKVQWNQFSLPGRIKQYIGFIEKAIIEGNLTGFKKEMLQSYVQSALKQFHETGRWQGLYQVLEDQGGAWAEAMKDPEKSMGVIDGLFEHEMSKSDPIYQKLQKAVMEAEEVARVIQWIQQTLDEGDNAHQEYHELASPWQAQYQQYQQNSQDLQDAANELGIDLNSKTAAHVEVEVKPVDDYFMGMPGLVAYNDDQEVGALVFHPETDRVAVEHAEVAPTFRDTDVFMQLAAGLVRWMRDTNNVKPISMRTIYPGIKSLVDRWNSRFENVPEDLESDLYDINQIAPGRTDMAWFYSSFDAPLENPVNYEWIPWTEQELSQWDAQNDKTQMQWKRNARNLTRGARRRGYAGTVTGRDLWLLQNRYQGNCAYCGQPGADSWDHVVPLSQGGEHTPSNILPAHIACNSELNGWMNRNRDYVNPTIDQMSPTWTIQPAEAKTAIVDIGKCAHCGGSIGADGFCMQCGRFNNEFWRPQRVPRFQQGMPVQTPQVRPELALSASWKPQRIARLHGFRVWSADLHEMAEQKRLEAKDAIKAWSGERWQLAWALIQQMPDQGYKLMPWLTREITKRDLMDTQQWHHIQDIMEQASKWFDWSREHNKPLPEFNRKDFGFDQMEQWVYEMNASQSTEGGWLDSTPVYTWPDGWHIDRVGASDLAREGELMGHCVGGYCDVVTQGNSSIFSLRDPKGMPHVTLEIRGDYDGKSAPMTHNDSLNVIQVQGKQDTEPIAEYRERIDQWFEYLQENGWIIDEDDPDREPETEYEEHPDGPYYFENPDDYLQYHDYMTDEWHRENNFGEDEEGNWEGNTITYQLPRTLVLNARTADDFADKAYDFIRGWEAGRYTDQDALKFVQALWMAIHHSASDSQRYQNNIWPRQLPNGDYLYGEQLHNHIQEFWTQIQSYLYEMLEEGGPDPKTPSGPLFDADEYNQPQISKQAEAFLTLMHRFNGAPHEWQEPIMTQKRDEEDNYLYRDRDTGQEVTTPRTDTNWGNQAIMVPKLQEGTSQPMMATRYLNWPGEGAWPKTNYPDYFRNNGLDEFPAPVISSWIPLEGHHSAPNGTEAQPWTLTSAWKKIPESDELRGIATNYMANQGWGDYDPPKEFPDVDPERARLIAEEYEKMEHNPNDPKVREAYDALIRETMAQYDYLVKNGYQMEFEPYGENPYNSPWDAINDIRENKHLYVYPTYKAFGQGDDDGLGNFDHPLVEHAGFEWNEGPQRKTPVTYNDVFRGVHDVFGHAKEGVGFRADGEENAWRQHSAMYSEPARRALTSETRGQNSWVNYGPYGQQNQIADQANTVYAEQKAGIMPDWTVYEGAHDE